MLGARLEDFGQPGTEIVFADRILIDSIVVIFVDAITTVLWSDWFGGWLGGGGCGTRASSPFGVNGVITIKMMISTRRTSIIGVMLMSDFGPPCPPTAIDIKLLP